MIRSYLVPLAAASAWAAPLLWAASAMSADVPPPQLSGVPVPESQIEMAIGRLDDLAAEVMERSGVPGLAVAVVWKGRTVYVKGFGVRKAGTHEPVDADTVFQLASLSKSITGTIVAQQATVGAVTWNTPVAKVLPWFQLNDPWVTSNVTIADLMSHRSGLPDHAGDDLEDIGFDRRQVLERLRQLPLKPFRSSYAYTNFGVTAAAEAVAAAAGKDWATLAEEVLYVPLGMRSTSSRFSDFEKRSNRAVGHVLVDGVFEARYQRQPDAQSPAGGVSSSVNDLARWMTLVLGDGTFEGRVMIDPKQLLPAITPQIVSAPSYAPDARPGFYGYGFAVVITPAGRLESQHSGAFTMGAGTHFSLLTSLDIGIVVLTNAAPTGAAETLSSGFMDLVQFGKIERDWFPAWQGIMAPVTAPQGSLVGATRPAEPKPPANLSAYAGEYLNPYYGPLRISQNGDGLTISIGPAGVEYPLAHWDADRFVFSPANENQPDGSISAIAFESGGQDGFGSLEVEYLNEVGMGRFERRQ